ncbi:2-amino-4,5-dihydroxy-6-one-heptanoic acid-7-phosphate synthase [Enhygromyxa salina]|uniref:2-amino-4,5-dihydroxy-6-one-heptanoic acid-7-phosphate synthase n=1 Tax=Enhygromyxa salina TaxID=215803 RepID=A0A2S9XIL4_9BACT|nr:2-amino-4,5-dihydroxy-6-one-heptanoic acid-7-phosphate synthase [Enhygromyxa salina]PRP92719.1 2-amino-4,5-dihydroxy-6-one-heptanoic acid-7-phosphate synthase [Enhygromyxa salina]
MSNSSNTKLRLRRIFAADGRSVLIALDHLSRPGAGVRLRDPGRVLREVAAAGVDGVFVQAGLLMRCRAELGRTTAILSHPRELASDRGAVEHALRLGADAIKAEALPGSATETDSVAKLAALALECERWAMPLVAEMLPLGFKAKDQHTPAQLADVARLGADLGADVVKTRYTGDPDSFAELVALAEVPVVVLGGAKEELRPLFAMVRAVLDAGAAGVAIGRSVWSSDKPGHVAGALMRLVHEGVGVDAALTGVTRVFVGPGW